MIHSVTNNTEMRILAQKRSGHHAIVNWIVSQCSGNVCYLNYAQPGTNPFSTASQNLRLEGLDNYNPLQIDYKKEAAGKLTKKDYLIYTYEENQLHAVLTETFEQKRIAMLGSSDKAYDILVIRDPFNILASRLKLERLQLSRQRGMSNSLHDCKELWKSYAREYLGVTQHRKQTPVNILYNQWFKSPDYRKHVSQTLGLEFNDASLNTVRHEYGGGSSFDENRFHGRAQKMRVLERWKVFVKDPEYRALVRDPELFELSIEIFGHMPGTEQLLKG